MADTDFTSYSVSVDDEDIAGVIDYANHAIAVTVPAGTTITGLVSKFAIYDASASVKIGSTRQVSGTTSNDWTSGTAKTYKVASGGVTQEWAVTVTVEEAPEGGGGGGDVGGGDGGDVGGGDGGDVGGGDGGGGDGGDGEE